MPQQGLAPGENELAGEQLIGDALQPSLELPYSVDEWNLQEQLRAPRNSGAPLNAAKSFL